jgi:hypothetical protein
MDITPTTLSLLGIPLSPAMDGRVLEEMMTEPCRAAGAATATEAATRPSDEDGSESAYSERERKLVEERLSGLGYL